MHIETHALLGWTLANLGGADRRLRKYVILAAVVPDVDSFPIVFGLESYGRWHHTFGHNLFFAGLFLAVVVWRCRSWRAFLLSTLGLASHLVGDGFLSRWDVYYFWPISQWGWQSVHSVGLEHPFNIALIYVGLLFAILIACWYKRTPVDLVSPGLDQLIISLFKSKKQQCQCCGGRSNHHCCQCGKPVCLKHGSITRTFEVLCPKCNDQKL